MQKDEAVERPYKLRMEMKQMSKREFWKKREYLHCPFPNCSYKSKVLNVFHRHLQTAHHLTWQESKLIVAVEFAKQGGVLETPFKSGEGETMKNNSKTGDYSRVDEALQDVQDDIEFDFCEEKTNKIKNVHLSMRKTASKR